jgi:hypothetical protein
MMRKTYRKTNNAPPKSFSHLSQPRYPPKDRPKKLEPAKKRRARRATKIRRFKREKGPKIIALCRRKLKPKINFSLADL